MENNNNMSTADKENNGKLSTADKVKQIKQSFRLYMNGVTAESLRQKGLEYKICWGVSLQHLQEMAAEYGKDKSLAEELWLSGVRECKLLAILTYPVEAFDEPTADRWLEDVTNQELAEMLSFYILQHVPYAKTLAMRLLTSNNDMHLLCAFNILSRLFMKSQTLDNNKQQTLDENEVSVFLEKAHQCMENGTYALKHAASNCLLRYEY